MRSIAGWPLLSIALGGLVAGCGTDAATSEASAPLGQEVTVTGGEIAGRTIADSRLRVWEAIPYAVPPVGVLRWLPPRPVEPWEGVRATRGVSDICVQPTGGSGFYDRAGEPPPQSEDCLTLNVWSEASTADEGRPVMVWIHGGALITGSGGQYDGTVLASKGVVLVTLNYRLGPFGFMAHPALSAESERGVSGNYGFLDQIAALEWVRDNVAAFGGDPGRVTIFGESAGSLSVNVMQATPLARGLFHGVIAESGGAFHPLTYLSEDKPWSLSAESIGEQLAGALLDGAAGDEVLSAMRAVPAQEVLEAFSADPVVSNYWALANVDGHVLPAEVDTIYAEGRQADVPVMIGSNADEGTTMVDLILPAFGDGLEGYRAWARASHPALVEELLAIYPANDDAEARQSFADAVCDEWFTFHMRRWARSMAAVSSPVYLYFFSYAPPIPEQERYGAFHAAEIGYVFGTLEQFGASPGPADEALSDAVSDIWVRFATTGDPNGGDLETWEPFTADNEAYMEIGRTLEAKSHLRMEKMDLIERSFAARRAGQGGVTSTGM